jgi:hypothetical protein
MTVTELENVIAEMEKSGAETPLNPDTPHRFTMSFKSEKQRSDGTWEEVVNMTVDHPASNAATHAYFQSKLLAMLLQAHNMTIGRLKKAGVLNPSSVATPLVGPKK